MTYQTADTENMFLKPHPYALTAGTPTQLTGPDARHIRTSNYFLPILY